MHFKLQNDQEKPYISLSLSSHGSEVFYSQVDSTDELRRLADFIRHPKGTLAQLSTIKNLILVDDRVRQPLFNGLEFNSFRDSGLSWLITKANPDKQTNNELDFFINNFFRFVENLLFLLS